MFLLNKRLYKWNFSELLSIISFFQFLVHFKVHCPDSVNIFCNTQCYNVPFSAHYSKTDLKNALFCEFCISIKYKFRFNVSSQPVYFLLIAEQKESRHDSVRPCLAAMWGEVSFYKIQPRQKRLARGKWPGNSPPLLRKISRMECLWIAVFQNDTSAHMAEKDMA